MSSEELLSIVVLSLVLYGINLSTLKMSILVIFILAVTNQFVEITNCWVVTCKLIIIIGTISILLMSIGEEIIIQPIRSAPILVSIVALSSLLLVSSID
jgi:hypothetical protein